MWILVICQSEFIVVVLAYLHYWEQFCHWEEIYVVELTIVVEEIVRVLAETIVVCFLFGFWVLQYVLFLKLLTYFCSINLIITCLFFVILRNLLLFSLFTIYIVFHLNIFYIFNHIWLFFLQFLLPHTEHKNLALFRGYKNSNIFTGHSHSQNRTVLVFLIWKIKFVELLVFWWDVQDGILVGRGFAQK